MANGKNKKMISFEVPEQLRTALRAEAYHRDITVSALIRQFLEEKLQSGAAGDNEKVIK